MDGNQDAGRHVPRLVALAESESERLSGQMSNGARQFPETGDFAPFCANRFCADGLFYFHVELFRCAGESPLQRRPKGMKTNEVCDRPLETFGAHPCFWAFIAA